MAERIPRPTLPRRWTSLALAGAAAGLTGGAPGLAQHQPTGRTPLTRMPIVTVQAEGGEAGEAQQVPAPLPQASSEGGEGGEAGVTLGLPPDVAYLTELAVVEGHMRASALLYAKGMADEAVALSYHPEAEMMDQVRADLAARGAADFTPAMTAMSEAMAAGAAQAEVEARLADLQALIGAAAAKGTGALNLRFAALVALVKAAATEYAGAITDGKVTDPLAFHEAWAFLQLASEAAIALGQAGDPVAAKAAARVGEALKGADAAFGDILARDLVAQDPGILLAVAGRVELAASQVRP